MFAPPSSTTVPEGNPGAVANPPVVVQLPSENFMFPSPTISKFVLV